MVMIEMTSRSKKRRKKKNQKEEGYIEQRSNRETNGSRKRVDEEQEG